MNTARGGTLSAFGLIAPVQLMLGLVIFVPALYVVWLSFQQSTFGQNAVFVGTDNYARVIGDPYFWRALLNTVIIVVVVVHVELVIGLGVALLFASGVPFRPIDAGDRACALCRQRGVGGRDVALPVRSRRRAR